MILFSYFYWFIRRNGQFTKFFQDDLKLVDIDDSTRNMFHFKKEIIKKK